MNLKVCLTFCVCFALCVALILQPRTVYRQWEWEADFKEGNHSPTEISGRCPLDYIPLIHSRGYYLSGLSLTSQTLIDKLGAFFHRILITSVGNPLHLVVCFYHPNPVESFPASSFVLYSHQIKRTLVNHFYHSFSKLYVKVVVLRKAQKQIFEWLRALPFTNSGLCLISHWYLSNTGWFLADW